MSAQIQQKKYFPELTGLRGIGFLIVLVAHVGQAYKAYYVAGKIGVGLFFVLSAFFLTEYFSRTMGATHTIRSWRDYFLKRIGRLYPMYIVMLLVELLLGRYTVERVVTHLLLLDGRQHYWTIPVEFQFYALMPFLALVLFKLLKGNVLKSLVFLVLIFAGYIILYDVMTPHFAVSLASQTSLFFYVSSFLVGISLALIQPYLTGTITKIGMYSALGLIIASIPYSYNAIVSAGTSIQLVWIFSAYSVLWGIVIAGLQAGPSMVKTFLQLSPLRYLGTISYSGYIVHILVISSIRMIFPDSVTLGFVGSLAVTVFVATYTYRYIEKPFINCYNGVPIYVRQKIIFS